MNPGTLDRPAELWQQTPTRSASGEVTPAWAKACSLWASKSLPWGGTRTAEDGAVARAVSTCSILIRWTVLLRQSAPLSDFELRLNESGERFRILSAADFQGRRAYTQLQCEQITEGLR